MRSTEIVKVNIVHGSVEPAKRHYNNWPSLRAEGILYRNETDRDRVASRHINMQRDDLLAIFSFVLFVVRALWFILGFSPVRAA